MYSYDDMPTPTAEELGQWCREAYKKLRFKQQILNCYLDWSVTITADETNILAFPLTQSEEWKDIKGRIQFKFPSKALGAMLQRKIHFNNLEVGCHIEIDRQPNEYRPDIHVLMCFFHI